MIFEHGADGHAAHHVFYGTNAGGLGDVYDCPRLGLDRGL